MHYGRLVLVSIVAMVSVSVSMIAQPEPSWAAENEVPHHEPPPSESLFFPGTSTPYPAEDTSTEVNRDASALSPQVSLSPEGKKRFAAARPRLILALSGGAYKTVAQIGVLRSLEQHNIRVDGIVGTSMGATIGALYCAGVPLDDIEAMFVDNAIQGAMLKGARRSMLCRPLEPIRHLVKGKRYAGITDGKGYLALLEQRLPATFADLQIPFGAVVTNLTDGQTTVLTHGDLPQAVFASNCVPTIYRPHMIDGKLYVDGGLKANLPSNIAQKMGADVVVAVLVDTAVKPVRNRDLKSKKAFMMRVMDIMMASSDQMQTRSSDILIYPNVDFIPWITKDPKILKRGIEAGQRAADSVAARIVREIVASDQQRGAPTSLRGASPLKPVSAMKGSGAMSKLISEVDQRKADRKDY